MLAQGAVKGIVKGLLGEPIMPKGVAYASRPTNEAEASFYDMVSSRGIRLYRKGWPDYLILRPDGKFALVEVKRSASHKLRPGQDHFLTLLSKFSVPCYLWSPSSGFHKITVDGKFIPTSNDLVLGSHTPRSISLANRDDVAPWDV